MELNEDEYVAAEKQLTALEEKLNAAEGGLSSIHGILSATETKLTSLNNIVPHTEPLSSRQTQPENKVVTSSSTKGDSEPVPVPENSQDEDDEAVIVREVTKALNDQLSPEVVTVKAEVGCGGSAKLEIFIVSALFEGQALLKRHKSVQAAVRTIPQADVRVHAITITKSLTPSQYQALSN